MIDTDSITRYPFFTALTQLPFIDAIYVYGSRALGTARDTSDIDLALLCPGATDEEWRQAQAIIAQAETLLPIDCERLDKLPDTLFRMRLERMLVPLYVRPWYFEQQIIQDDMLPLAYDAVRILRGKILIAAREADQLFIANEFQKFLLRFCNLLRKCLKLHGTYAHTPRSCLGEALQEGWLSDYRLWERMLEHATLLHYGITDSMLLEVWPCLPEYLAAIESALPLIQRSLPFSDA